MGTTDFSSSPSIDTLEFPEFPNGDFVGLTVALDVTGWYLKTISAF